MITLMPQNHMYVLSDENYLVQYASLEDVYKYISISQMK
jgi:hypothetical protein